MTRKNVKGIVVEKLDKDIILLTRSGSFLRIPTAGRSFSPGMEVEISNPFLRKLPFAISAACVAAVLFIAAALYLMQPVLTTPVAYLALDINPSIVFSLDKNAVVIEAKPINADGEKILEVLETEGVSAFAVLENLLQVAYTNQFLAKGKDNIIIISLAAPEGFIISEDDLRCSVSEQLLQLEVDTYLKITISGLDKVETAKQMAIPLNALLLAEEMKKAMKVDESRSLLEGTSPLPVKNFLQTVNPSDIFSQDELVAGEGRKERIENLPQPKDDQEPAGNDDHDGKPVDFPALPPPEPELPTNPNDRGTPAP